MLPNGVCAQSMLGRLQSVHLVLHGSFDASLQEMLSNCGPLERLDLELVDAASIELEDFFLNQLKAIRISGASVSTLAVGDHSFGQLQYWPSLDLPQLRFLHIGAGSFPLVPSITIDDSSLPRLERLVFDAASMKGASSLLLQGRTSALLGPRPPPPHDALLRRLLLHAALRQRLLPLARSSPFPVDATEKQKREMILAHGGSFFLESTRSPPLPARPARSVAAVLRRRLLPPLSVAPPPPPPAPHRPPHRRLLLRRADRAGPDRHCPPAPVVGQRQSALRLAAPFPLLQASLLMRRSPLAAIPGHGAIRLPRRGTV